MESSYGEGGGEMSLRHSPPKRVLLSWSSGKDSVWALHMLRQQPDLEVTALLTTFNSAADRVAMHAVRRALVETQAERTGIPLWAIELLGLALMRSMKSACAAFASAPSPKALAQWRSAICFSKTFATIACGN